MGNLFPSRCGDRGAGTRRNRMPSCTVPNWPHRSVQVDLPSQPKHVAPYMPSGDSSCAAALALASCSAEDSVLDIGCGDGVIVFAAVHQANVKRAIGWDIDIGLLGIAREQAKGESRMEFEFKDCMCEATCEELVQMARDRTVSLMYIFLLPEGMTFLEPTIRRCLEANDALRVVVKRFPFESIQSTKQDAEEELYLYQGG